MLFLRLGEQIEELVRKAGNYEWYITDYKFVGKPTAI
jgi:hypothetical protein